MDTKHSSFLLIILLSSVTGLFGQDIDNSLRELDEGEIWQIDTAVSYDLTVTNPVYSDLEIREYELNVYSGQPPVDYNYLFTFFPPEAEEDIRSIAYGIYINNSNIYIYEDGDLIGFYGSIDTGEDVTIKRDTNQYGICYIKYFKDEIILRAVQSDISDNFMIYEYFPDGDGADPVNLISPFSLKAFIKHPVYGGDSGTIDLNPIGGVPPYTYSWHHGPTTKSLKGVPTGEYTVDITDNDTVQRTKTFEIVYKTSILLPETFVANSKGEIVKHPNSEEDDEMMRSVNTMYFESNANWSEAIIDFDTGGVFYFGIDSIFEIWDDPSKMPIGFAGIENVLYVYSDGDIIVNLGEVFGDVRLKIGLLNDDLYLLKNDVIVYTDYNLPTEIISNLKLYAKIALDELTKVKSWKSSVGSKKSDRNYFGTLKKKLDGSYYVMTNKVKFRYDDKYHDTDGLQYKIFDWNRNNISGTVLKTNHHHGLNYHSILSSNLSDNEYYTLEVTDNKNEMLQMQFLFIRLPIIDPFSFIRYVPYISWVNCCTSPPTIDPNPRIISNNIDLYSDNE